MPQPPSGGNNAHLGSTVLFSWAPQRPLNFLAVNYNNNSLTTKAFVRAVNWEVEAKPIRENLKELVEEHRVGWTTCTSA